MRTASRMLFAWRRDRSCGSGWIEGCPLLLGRVQPLGSIAPYLWESLLNHRKTQSTPPSSTVWPQPPPLTWQSPPKNSLLSWAQSEAIRFSAQAIGSNWMIPVWQFTGNDWLKTCCGLMKSGTHCWQTLPCVPKPKGKRSWQGTPRSVRRRFWSPIGSHWYQVSRVYRGNDSMQSARLVNRSK